MKSQVGFLGLHTGKLQKVAETSWDPDRMKNARDFPLSFLCFP
jgi:hypothetical protein